MSSEREDLVRTTALSYNIPLEVARALVDGAIDDANALIGDGRALAHSYAEFLEQTKHITPNANFSYPYVKLIAEYADRIRSGDLMQLTISLPPRIGKSEALTVRLPVYWLEHFPTDRIILASYNRELATSFSARAMRLYAERNPRAIRKESVDDWENVYGGGVVAAGVGSGITGRGASCLSGSSVIYTRDGDVYASELYRRWRGAEVIAYDHERGVSRWCRIVAAMETAVYRQMCRIVTVGGKRLLVTCDHRIFVSGFGYVPAGLLEPGDELITVERNRICGTDVVSSITRFQSGDCVYDFQVEECRNLFASGLLVHNCIIIDDPIKGAEEANSPTMRRKLTDWWKTDLRTRRNKLSKTPTIVICTRWHPEDLIGYILSNSDEGEWEVVNIPAIAVDGEIDPLGRQPGESVCEDRLPIADLLKMQREMGPEFEALYQGNPLPPAGGMFKTDKIRIVDASPVDAIRCRYWDRAATEGKGDWTVGLEMAINPEGKIYIEDVVRGRWEDDEVLRNMRQNAEIDRQNFPDIITYFEREPGASGKSTAQHTVVYMAGYAVEWDEPDGNKIARARPFAAQVNAGNVYLVRAPWNRDYLNELSSFRPNSGSKDDQVDASSGAYKKLAIDFIRVNVR